jgi:hypothetical protein
MLSHAAINSLGLVLDIVGVVLIWKFSLGRPLVIKNSKGEDFPVSLGKPESAALYNRLDHMGVWLILIGFGLQICSNWVT